MTNNQLAENSVNQLLNSVRLARDNAERADNRVDHSFYFALTIALQELQARRKAAMDSEPVAWLAIYHGEVYDEAISITRSVVEAQADHFGWESALTEIIPLYRHAQPAPVVMDDEKLRALFDAWFASDCSFDQSPEASEADNIAWRESYWYVWQRCRAAMLQAGNSPVIPDCWKLVPVEPNGDMLAAAQDAYGETDGDIASTLRAAIAAAPQEVKSES